MMWASIFSGSGGVNKVLQERNMKCRLNSHVSGKFLFIGYGDNFKGSYEPGIEFLFPVVFLMSLIESQTLSPGKYVSPLHLSAWCLCSSVAVVMC